MTNSSIYAVFERMWQHVLAKFNNYVSIEIFNDNIGNATQSALDEKADLEHEHDDLYYAKDETLELITVNYIDNICGAAIYSVNEVTF